MPVQTCLPVCIWIGFLLIRENKRFRSEKEICLIWACSSVFPNWCRTCDGDYATQMWLLIPDHQFLCSHVLLFLFRPPGQLQLDLIRLRLRFVDWPGPWWQMVDYPTKPTQDPPPVPGCCWKQQKSQQPDLPTVGQLAPQTAHTLGPSNFLASFSSLPSFLFYFLL